jgi:prepilin-type N-terminal cleavage/methylation domain-containing protein
MDQRNNAFTLIELIIVVVIIGILALVAIPRYFANVAKAQKSQVMANLDTVRQAQLAYYATYGVYRSSFPIAVTLDGDTIINMGDPSNATWTYVTAQSAVDGCSPNWYVQANKQPGSTCYYWMCVSSGNTSRSTCTP